MMENLILGLVSGVIVAILVVAFRPFWYQVLIPWFEERVYKDAKIEGAWFSLYPTTEGNRQETITLKRQAHQVSGTIICTVGGLDEGERYHVSGSFRNMILALIYESEDRSKTDRGTITLKLVRNAWRLEGKIGVYASYTDKIDALDVIWFRSKEDLSEVVEEVENHDKEMTQIREQRLSAETASHKLTSTVEKKEAEKSPVIDHKHD
jgi:hypothetical protein